MQWGIVRRPVATWFIIWLVKKKCEQNFKTKDCCGLCVELAKEGETVDVMAVVKSGECRLLRQVVASVTRANKQQA